MEERYSPLHSYPSRIFICAYCGSKTLCEVHSNRVVGVEYDSYGVLHEVYEDVDDVEIMCCSCGHRDGLAVLELSEKEYYWELDETESDEVRLKRALELIEKGEAEIVSDTTYELDISNNKDFLVKVIEDCKYEEVRKLAKRVLKKIAPQIVLDSI